MLRRWNVWKKLAVALWGKKAPASGIGSCLAAQSGCQMCDDHYILNRNQFCMITSEPVGKIALYYNVSTIYLNVTSFLFLLVSYHSKRNRYFISYYGISVCTSSKLHLV